MPPFGISTAKQLELAMKVRMCVSIAGHPEPRYDLDSFSFAPGDEVDLHPELAAAWLASGHAEEIPEIAVPEETKKAKRSTRSQESE
jgi:hypothetical protein